MDSSNMVYIQAREAYISLINYAKGIDSKLPLALEDHVGAFDRMNQIEMNANHVENLLNLPEDLQASLTRDLNLKSDFKASFSQLILSIVD